MADYQLTLPMALGAAPIQSMNNRNVRVHTGAGDFIWKAYTCHDNPEEIRYEHTLLAWLGSRELSFAVPAPLPGRDGETLRRSADWWSALTPWHPGAQLNPSAPDQVELLGAAVGELLAELQHYPMLSRPGHTLFGALFQFPPPERDPFTLTPARLGVPNTSATEDLLGWWRGEAARLHVFVEGLYRSLPRQLCHNDFAPANVLVAGDRVSAVLDFEFAAPAARALDVAMGLRMAMRVWENPEPWEMVRRFCRGYTRRLSIARAEVSAMPQLLRLRGAITVLWWLGRRSATEDPATVLDRIQYLRNAAGWLDRHERGFLDVLSEAAV